MKIQVCGIRFSVTKALTLLPKAIWHATTVNNARRHRKTKINKDEKHQQ